ncbi:MAG: Gfo/Idh/MocA family oxidoreductase [Myxococcota bacterium]
MDARLPLAVVGAGRAGRARVRALGESPRARLAAVVSRGDPGGPTFADVLADPAVAGVILCTPNLLHGSQARAALDARKHVLVEFPAAPGPSELRALLARAHGYGRVLHEEHIELLSPSQAWLREHARPLGRPRGGTLEFTGSDEGWIADPALAGTPALCALARLHRLVDLFGEAEVRGATLARRAGYRLEVELGFASGGAVTLVETRAPSGVRATHWRVECEHGPLGDPPAERPANLFARDLDCFVARVSEHAAPYVSDARSLHVLELVEAIERRLC